MAVHDVGPFALLLRRWREAAALSQEELAERAGLTPKAIGALERGERRRPYPSTVRAIAGALGLDDTGLEALVDAARGRSADAAPRSAAPTTDLSEPALGRDRNPAPTPNTAAQDAPIPAPPTPTIGRERAHAEVRSLLVERRARVVTLTGPGGVGKTRLAWDVAAGLRHEGWVTVPVELAPVSAVDLVLPTIARALGVRAGADDLVARVAAVIGDADRLVVLDNLEHLLDAAGAIADLLERCAGLRVLATSRAPLRIRAEQEYPVPCLELPSADEPDVVRAAPAVRLFIDRAGAAAPGLVLDRDALAAVATICRRLDGLPLALELAAAHTRYVPPVRLVGRLDRALGEARLRDLPERQRTMGATLDWSMGLCTDAERTSLQALAVFVGGFDLDAAEAVAGTAGAAALEGLAEQSLVIVDRSAPANEARFRLLQPVRGYAAERTTPNDAATFTRRHAEHYAAMCAAARPGLRGTDQARWLDTLERDHADVAAALGSLVANGDLAGAATIIADSWPYWALRGRVGEARRLIGQVLEAPGFAQLDDGGRAAGLVGFSGPALAIGDDAGVLRHAGEAIGLARSAGEDRLLGEALLLVASAAMFTGESRRADEAVDELEPLAGGLGDGWLLAHAAAVRGQLAILADDLAGAGRILAAAEEVARSSAGPFTLAMVLNVRATLAVLEGRDDLVLERLSEAATIAAEVGTTWTLVYTLGGLAGLALRRDEPALAATLFSAGAATAERSMLHISFGPDAAAAAAQLSLVRQRLDAEGFARAWAAGRALGPGEVVGLLGALSAPRARS